MTIERRSTLQGEPDHRRLDELAFLHEIAQLATLARDWDELMRSIVDGTTAAMGVEVCSFYLADHDRTRLTLAATNGLDRSQVGRVSLAWGQGITGRVAAIAHADRRSRTSPSIRPLLVGPRVRHRGPRAGCCRCRSSGTTGSSACSTSRPAVRVGFGDDEIAFLADDRRAAGRHRREGPPDGRGRGTPRPADRPRRRALRAAERRDPRAADAAVGRAGLRRPAGRGRRRPTRASPSAEAWRRPRVGAARPARPARRFRSWPRSAARA